MGHTVLVSLLVRALEPRNRNVTLVLQNNELYMTRQIKNFTNGIRYNALTADYWKRVIGDGADKQFLMGQMSCLESTRDESPRPQV